MFRIGLSVYLMLVTLAGPWLCCCQLPRLSAQFIALMRIDKAKPSASNHSCCQHRMPVKDPQPPAHPTDPSCPCQGNRQASPALVSLDSEGAKQLDRDQNAQAVGLLDCDLLSGVFTPSATLTLTSSALSSPVLSGRDLLSSLHILRC